MRRVCFVILIFLAISALHAEQYYIEEYGYVIDLPTGWEVLDSERMERVSFTDSDHKAVFQIMSFGGNQFFSPQAIEKHVSDSLGAQGESEAFEFSGRKTVFADKTFPAGRYSARAYMAFIDGAETDFALMAFTSEEYYGKYHDFLLSALDSFSLSVEEKLVPGLVSQFFYPYPGLEKSDFILRFEGSDLPFRSDPATHEAAQVLIEREARILASDPELNVGAWRRYYRMIYRDNFPRLANLAFRLEREMRGAGVPKNEYPSKILSWLQGFEYSRTGSLSDFLGPTLCLVENQGDCDSLGLTYAILLHHMEIDAILMVSSEYGHAVAAVDVDGNGARFEFDGKSYLIAELTAPVAIGLIDQQMSDPAGWIGVQLR